MKIGSDDREDRVDPKRTAMTRRADPERIHQARRDAIRNRLISSGKDPDVAERWCDAC